MYENILTLNIMKEMPIDDIIRLYQQGYRLEGMYPIESLQCTTSIVPDRILAYVGDIIRLTATTSPTVSDGTLVTFKGATMVSSRPVEITIGTCTTSNGSCFVDWDTITAHAGRAYSITAEVEDCTPTPIDITLKTAPPKWEDVIFIAIVAVPSTLLTIHMLAKK